MPGRPIGGARAAATNKLRHGPDFYKKIGAKGGVSNIKPKGFSLYSEERLIEISRKGGKISRPPSHRRTASK